MADLEQNKSTSTARRQLEETGKPLVVRPPLPGVNAEPFAYVTEVDETTDPPSHTVILAVGAQFGKSGPIVKHLTALEGGTVAVNALVRIVRHGVIDVIEVVTGAPSSTGSGNSVPVVAGFIRFFTGSG